MNPFEQDEDYLEYRDFGELHEFAIGAGLETDPEPSPAPLIEPLIEAVETASPPPIGTAADRRALVELTDDDLDEEELAAIWVPPTAAEILKQPLSKPNYLLTGLVVEARNTVIHVGKGVRSNVFAEILGYSLAGGIQFSPFGKSEPLPTLMAFGGSEWHLVKEQLSLITNQIENQDDRAKAVSNLYVSRPRQRMVDDDEKVNYSWEARLFKNSIPKGCKVVIFPDGATCIGPRSREDYHSPFSRLVRDLNKMGIATVSFSLE
jgi:hypothetical protein